MRVSRIPAGQDTRQGEPILVESRRPCQLLGIDVGTWRVRER
jgi:hypothetical protein